MSLQVPQLPAEVGTWLAKAFGGNAEHYQLLADTAQQHGYLLSSPLELGEGRNSVDKLPAAVRSWLDRALIAGNFSGYRLLEDELRERGYSISKSSLQRYGKKIERRMAAIKASTEAAKLISEGARDDQDARSEAVIALVQTELFETIVNLQEASDVEDPAERIGLLSSAAKNIATLTRASVAQKRHAADVRQAAREELLREQAAELDKTVQAGGMDEEQAMFWRKKFLGVQ